MKQILLLAVFISISIGVLACDVCGAGATTATGGLMPFYHKNYLRAGWFHTPFETVNEYGNNTKDYFHTTEISLRYHFSERWKINVHQPLSFNFRQSELEREQKLSGLGDTRINAFYTLLNRKEISEKSTLSGEVGVGAILPIGKFDPDIHRENLPENFNPGNGTWGSFLQTNWVWQFEKTGLSSAASIRLNAKSSDGYQYGNQTSTNLLFFTRQKVGGSLLLMPFAGIYYENISTDKYFNSQLKVEGTGGEGAFIQAGLNIVKNEWILGANFSQPISHNYSQNEVIPKTRFSIDLTYFFKSISTKVDKK